MLPKIENLKHPHREGYLFLKKISSKLENQEVFFHYLDDVVSLQILYKLGGLQNFLFTFSLGKGIKEGQRQEPLGAFSSFNRSLMLPREVMGHLRLRTMSPNTESGDKRQMRLEILGIKIACRMGRLDGSVS